MVTDAIFFQNFNANIWNEEACEMWRVDVLMNSFWMQGIVVFFTITKLGQHLYVLYYLHTKMMPGCVGIMNPEYI